MASRSGRFLCALCPLLILTLTPYLSTQTNDTTAAQPSPPAEGHDKPTVYESATAMRATTRMVVVDVVATGKKGEPVMDLQADDFTVQEDGHAQQVRSFSFQHPADASPLVVAAQPSAPRLPEHVFTNIPSYRTDRPLNVILVDALNSTLLNQMSVREGMFKLLRNLPPGQPVAVYALGERLLLLQDFTSDPAVLQTAVKNYSDHAPRQLKNPVGDPIGRALILSRIPAMMLPTLLRADQNLASMGADERVELTMDALRAIAHSLSAYPGRKNLIWLSASFPLSLNVDGLPKLKGEASMRNYERSLERMADALMSAQVAVYPIDARGMATVSFLAASGLDRHPLGVGYSDGSGVGLEPVSAELSDELLAAHETMNTLAEKTGGKAFYSTNDLDKAIRSSMDDGSTYYTLGYYPANKEWDGKFRKIQIRAQRRDLNLRYRIGYFAVDPGNYIHEDPRQRAHDFIQALTLESPASTALLFQARVLPPSDKTGNKVLVDFAVDPHAISFLQGKDGLAHAMLKCAVEVYSDKGVPIRTEASDVTTALQPDAYSHVLRTNLPCRTSFALDEGSYILRLAVRDERTGLIGSQNVEVKVTPKEGTN
jgi:VWFA-related protein